MHGGSDLEARENSAEALRKLMGACW